MTEIVNASFPVGSMKPVVPDPGLVIFQPCGYPMVKPVPVNVVNAGVVGVGPGVGVDEVVVPPPPHAASTNNCKLHRARKSQRRLVCWIVNNVLLLSKSDQNRYASRKVSR